VDVSNWQGQIDWASLRRQGFEFAWSQATDGGGFHNPYFPQHRDGARAAGIAFGAYHFLRSTSTIDAQLANVAAHIGDKSIPVSIDCEPAGSSSPNLWHVREFIRKAPAHGLKVGFLYLPHFHWLALGSPSLRGLPPLWQASYGANRTGYASTVYAGTGGDRNRAWARQGGATPTILQFGSNGVVDGHPGRLDVDAFRGSVAALRATRRFV
jgi:GH25 family lysozyme M1 (1,4-beta-N-acetylmuramidase)